MNTFWAVMAVLLFVAILGGVTGILTADKIKNLFAKPSAKNPPETGKISAQELQVIVLHQIKEIAEFGVLKQSFDSSFNYCDDRKVFGLSVPLTSNEIKVHYKGEITCGCDLSRAVYANDSYNNRIKIIIPNGKVLNIREIPGTIETEEKKSGIFSRAVDIKKYDKELRRSLDDMERHLIGEGILQKANKRVHDSLTKLITGINRGIEVEIIFIDDNGLNGRLNSSNDLPRLND